MTGNHLDNLAVAIVSAATAAIVDVAPRYDGPTADQLDDEQRRMIREMAQSVSQRMIEAIIRDSYLRGFGAVSTTTLREVIERIREQP